ncbi:hypothetical protein BJV78DRAFT_1240659 [Lactifluus subvellereus]|nr:hypothetical protein BJV78DRAFT_1240659 [Lactifluus subvellereus]
MQLAHGLLSAFVAVSTLSFSLPAVASPGRSLRQHAERRATLDVCATVDASLLTWIDLVLPPSSYEGCLDICLCLSALPVAVETNDELRLLAKTYGKIVVMQDLATLINYAPNKQNCRYPKYSQPVCRIDNPCDFNCEHPYVPRGKHCVCEYPYTLCNGVCGVFKHGCGSAVPHPYQRGINPNLKARSHGIFTHEDALATCDEGEEVCGVYQGSAAFECLNTDITLESCGGCMAPSPFLTSEQGPEGVDCTTLPHVQDVRCSAGQCHVKRCDDGFVPSPNHRECVHDRFVIQPVQF